MKDIGKKGEFVDQVDYYRWPLFEDFNSTPEFLTAYEAIYGIPFVTAASEEVQPKLEQLQEEAKREGQIARRIEEQGAPRTKAVRPKKRKRKIQLH
jgi:hypothetical protein